METRSLNTWVEISRAAYANNINFFKKLISPRTELAIVIKANAYGHGMLGIAGIAARNGINFFCVHSLEEAQELRHAGFDQKILVLGPVPLARLEEAVGLNLELALYNLENIQILNEAAKKLNKPVKIHLKLETGANRQGITESDLNNFLDTLKSKKFIKLEAIYSHFANVEDTTDNSYATQQLERFNKMSGEIAKNGFTSASWRIKKHIAATAAVLLLPEIHFDMIRVGIGQYGSWPSEKVKISYEKKHGGKAIDGLLSPVMSWKTRISQIKQVSKGGFIGYGCAYQAKKDMVIAVLPVGYADGYDRKLSNKGYVLIKGRKAPVVGRVCMNLTMVDITDIKDVKLEDEVVLLGRQGNEEIIAEYLAELIGTINYEVVTRINWQIPRMIV